MSQLSHFQNGVIFIMGSEQIKTSWGTPTREWDIDDIILTKRPYTIDRDGDTYYEHTNPIPEKHYIWMNREEPPHIPEPISDATLRVGWTGNTTFENVIHVVGTHTYHPGGTSTPFGYLRSYYPFKVKDEGVGDTITVRLTCQFIVVGHEMDPIIANCCRVYGDNHNSMVRTESVYSYDGTNSYVDFGGDFTFTRGTKGDVYAYVDCTDDDFNEKVNNGDYMYLDMKLEKL